MSDSQPPSLQPDSVPVRYHDLDALRAFAMLLGLVLHALISFMPVPFWPAQDIKQSPELYGMILSLIHGFRMPLFFFLSGFFTMMLWKKRGPGKLTSNRAMRILLPLVIGTILIWPLALGVGIWGGIKKAEIVKEQSEQRTELQKSEARTIWEAARHGDLDSLKRHLEEGADLNGRDGTGISVLNWGVMAGQEEVVGFLIEQDVDLNSRDKDNRIALHSAAFFGYPGIVKKLIVAGSDINVKGTANDTPLDSAFGEMGTVQWIAGLLRLEIDIENVKQGRPETRELLLAAGGKRAGDLSSQTKGNLIALFRAGAFFPVFHHLWFLHYLVWFTIAFIALAGLAKALKLKPLPRFLIRAPFCLLWVVPLTWVAQRMMGDPFGPDTAPGILIWPPIFFYYGIFVLFGALCFGRDSFMKSTRFGWALYLVLAAIIGILGVAAGKFGVEFEDSSRIIQPALAATYVWLMCFGLIGLFRFLFRKENRSIRWLSDSSYWLYLAHLPLMMAIQILVSDWEFPGVLKLLIVLFSTTGILLLMYRYLIRYTFIGTALNGKRFRN